MMRTFHTSIEQGVELIIKLLFVFILGLILSMAVTSKFNAHPDEYVHVKAVEYYQNHWLPPLVNDPEIRHTFSLYGNSRLMGFESYYFFNGKFSALANYFIQDALISMRLFNVLLFFILIILFFKSSPKVNPLFLVLLISPQIWYVFSYVNSDAFSLFISMFIIQQLISKNSLLNKYLYSPKLLSGVTGGILIAVLFSLQLLSKKNFYITLIFFALISVGKLIKLNGGQKRLIAKYFIIAGIVVVVIAPRFLYDAKLHGFNRSKTLAEYKEKFAKDGFKRSQINDTISYSGLFLKDKGVTFSELYLDTIDWYETNFYSFVGLYGYMSILSPFTYYLIMLLLYIATMVYLSFLSLSQKTIALKIAPLIFYLLFILLVLLSMRFSWIVDYQPQGRYLFAILGVLGFWFVKFLAVNKACFLKTMIVIIALVSIYSFLFTALNLIAKV